MEGNNLTLEEADDMFTKTCQRIKSLEEKAYDRLFPGYAELKKESEKLRKDHDNEPADAELAQNLGWPLDRVILLKKEGSNFKDRINSADTLPDMDNLVKEMPPLFQKEWRKIFGEKKKV